MDVNTIPKEINFDESFDEFDFWCTLLGASHLELASMSEEEIKQRMDEAQDILTQHHKHEQEQQNRLNFLQKLNNTFSEFEKNETNQQELSKGTKEQLKLKLRKLMCERGGSDIVNLLLEAAEGVSRSFGDTTCYENLDMENLSLYLQGTQGSDTFLLEASSNNQGDQYSRSTKGTRGKSRTKNITDNRRTRRIASSGGGSFDRFVPRRNSGFQKTADAIGNRLYSGGSGTFNKTQSLEGQGATFSTSGNYLGATFDGTSNRGGNFNKTRDDPNATHNLGGIFNRTRSVGPSSDDTFNRTRSVGGTFNRPKTLDSCTSNDGDQYSSFYSNSLIQEAFHDSESFDRSRRSDYDSSYEMNLTNREKDLACGISSPINPHPRLVSSPVTRSGFNNNNYNRIDCEFDEDRAKHYESDPSIGYFPENAYDATRYSGVNRLFDSNPTFGGINAMFQTVDKNATYDAGNRTFDAENDTFDDGNCNATFEMETFNAVNETLNADNETFNDGNGTFDAGN